jgi:hypothetical protein
MTIYSLIPQLQQISKFSVVFLNLPLPKILAFASHIIVCGIFSSILGQLPCLISFPLLYILYTTDFDSFNSRLGTSSNSVGRSAKSHLPIASLHILTVSTLKKQMAPSFYVFLQKTYYTSPLYPHFNHHSHVVKQSFIANHETNACLGTARGNQIN